ncbi:MAG: hypothetical protein ACI37N_02180 [Prevotella sp.]
MIERIGLMMMVLLSALTLTSCDEDTETAYDLDGIWQGTINGNYYQDRYGYTESWDTEIRFYQDGDFSRGGSGEERDWDYRGKCYSSRFDWKVRNGRIYLYYDDGYNIVIDRYDLYWRSNTQRFRGYFEDFDTGDQLASFDLVKVVDWHDFSKKSQDNGLFNEEKKE